MSLWSVLSLFGVLVLVFFSGAHSGPVLVEQARSSISLGPCTWVLDRKCPDQDVKFYLFTRKNRQDRQHVHIDETWEKSNLSSSYFNPYHPVKIVIHGYNSDMFLHPLIQMKDEYLQRGEYNVLYADWSNLSPGPCYISAVHNCQHVGKCIGQLIERILESGTANIHVIGFSLGAQVTNYVAKSLGSFIIPRITGLDPALPLFITAPVSEKLDPSDAAFVDVIHTNAFIQGKIERCGHVDFYMNGAVIQPGCFGNGENPIACSHHRAPDYFAESIRSFKGFWGWSCSSYINYLLGLCPPTNFLVLAGEDCHPDSKGMYMVTTSNHSPYALGKWTDLNTEHPQTVLPITPFSKANPLRQEIDQWGKLEGTFNNIMHFPTPYSQDPNDAESWPYFGVHGPKEITQTMEKDDNKIEGSNEDGKLVKKVTRRPVHISKRRENISAKPEEKNRRNFINEYKKNLTFGHIDRDIFQLPKFEEN